MIIQCSSCGTKYKFDEKKITGAGMKLKCSKCKNVFVVKKPGAPAPAKPAAPTSQPASAPATRTQAKSSCPYCHKSIPQNTHFCPHCGEDVTRKKAAADELTCGACHTKNPPNGRFCVGCGAPLDKEKRQPDKPAVAANCSECGAPNPGGAKFCPQCGAKMETDSAGTTDGPALSEKMKKMYAEQGLDGASDEAGGTIFPFTAGWGDEYSGDTIKRKGEDIKLILTLKALSGPEEGKEFTITKKNTIIGRSDADIVIDDFKISRNHAEIEILGYKFLLKDLESTNGTFLNDELTPADFLSHDDRIGIGDTTFQVIIEEERFV